MNEKIWFKNYPERVPRYIQPASYSSLADMFNKCVARYGDLPAFENFGKAISYNELDRLSGNFAAYLQKYGFVKGDRIAIQLPNILQYTVAMFGALRAGLIIVNVNPLYTAREMRDKFQDAGVKGIIIIANYAYRLEKIQCMTSIQKVIVTEIGDLAGAVKGRLINFIIKHIRKMVKPFNIPEAVGFKDAIKEGSKLLFTAVDTEVEDIAFLQYTGGTTGVSKAAVLKHRNILANVDQISAWMVPLIEDRKEIVVTPLPLYHIFALTVNLFAFFDKGAKNILITDPRNIPELVKELKSRKFTALTGVNTLFNALANNPEFRAAEFPSMKIVVAGGMSLQKAVAEKWLSITGIPVCEGYGLTEASPVLTCNPIDGTDRPGTIGLPLPSTDIKIVDDEGNEVGTGIAGEIIAQGPQVMDGYWNKPDETQLVLNNGWLSTGDIGFIDSDGFITIVDRKKDMVLISGFNVYPNEIEQVSVMHPKVLEAGATGGTNINGNEYVKLYIVRKDQSLTKEELLVHLRENLTNYKIPKVIEFRESLPKTNVGKILRRELK